MTKLIPVQFWLLLLVGIFAFPQVVVLRRFLMTSRAPQIPDLRSDKQVAFSITVLVLLEEFSVLYLPKQLVILHNRLIF